VGQCPTSRPGSFTRGKQPLYLLCRRLCGPQGRSEQAWRTENILPSAGFEPRTIEPVVSGSTDNATFHPNRPLPLHNNMKHTKFSKNKIIICIKICPFGLVRKLFLPPVYKWLLRHTTSWFYENEACNLITLYRFSLDIAMFSYHTEHNTPSYM
jgi:hypothetical protein